MYGWGSYLEEKVKVDFMIKIDYLVGVPICWVLSQIHKVGKIFKKDTDMKIKKCLVSINVDGVYDVVKSYLNQ